MENETRELIYKSDARRAILKADPYVSFCIDNIKPVDAVEVVHGRWAHIGEDCCVCSVCHKASIVDYYFCPECGTKMDLPQITEQTTDALMKMGENAHGERKSNGT